MRFRASHHYALPGGSPRDDREAFGDAARRHEHDYAVSVTVAGPIDPRTGFVIDLEALDRVLRHEVAAPLEGRSLNDAIPELAAGEGQPSTEWLARWLFDRLASRVPAPARLARVRVTESDLLAGEYPAGSGPGSAPSG